MNFPRSHHPYPKRDLATLWEQFKRVQRESEAMKVYEVREAPAAEQVEKHEEQERLKLER